MSTLIVIPARWRSTRLPGKPLSMVAGRTLLARVIDLATRSVAAMNVGIVVATDDDRVAQHARSMGCPAVITDPALPSGSDRALAAALAYAPTTQRIINLQGDAPFIAASTVRAVIATLDLVEFGCVTPIVHLDWAALDALRERKRRAPSSGTTCVRGADGRAFWFSKTILPIIRDEPARRQQDALSPVYQHIGLYAFTLDALRRFCAAPPTEPELAEGLEQLRLIELGVPIQTVAVPPAAIQMSGIDSPADIELAEQLISLHGDPYAREC